MSTDSHIWLNKQLTETANVCQQLYITTNMHLKGFLQMLSVMAENTGAHLLQPFALLHHTLSHSEVQDARCSCGMRLQGENIPPRFCHVIQKVIQKHFNLWIKFQLIITYQKVRQLIDSDMQQNAATCPENHQMEDSLCHSAVY